jgi:hypothetical protein
MKTKSQKSTTHYLLLLDRSGSMASCWPATMESLEGQMAAIKKLGEEHPDLPIRVTVSFFNTILSPFIKQAPARELLPIQFDSIDPEGGTALLDALGTSLNEINDQMEDGDDAVAVILTDGEENSSRTYTYDYVGGLIKHLKSTERWKFKMLGADFDSFTSIGSKINLTISENLYFKKSAMKETMDCEMANFSKFIAEKKIKFDEEF